MKKSSSGKSLSGKSSSGKSASTKLDFSDLPDRNNTPPRYRNVIGSGKPKKVTSKPTKTTSPSLSSSSSSIKKEVSSSSSSDESKINKLLPVYTKTKTELVSSGKSKAKKMTKSSLSSPLGTNELSSSSSFDEDKMKNVLKKNDSRLTKMKNKPTKTISSLFSPSTKSEVSSSSSSDEDNIKKEFPVSHKTKTGILGNGKPKSDTKPVKMTNKPTVEVKDSSSSASDSSGFSNSYFRPSSMVKDNIKAASIRHIPLNDAKVETPSSPSSISDSGC